MRVLADGPGSGSYSEMARELKGKKNRPLAITRLRLFRVLVNTPICRNYCRIRHGNRGRNLELKNEVSNFLGLFYAENRGFKPRFRGCPLL